MGNPRRHPRSLPPLRLRPHLLATPPQHLKLLGVLKAGRPPCRRVTYGGQRSLSASRQRPSRAAGGGAPLLPAYLLLSVPTILGVHGMIASLACIFQPVAQTARLPGGRPDAWDHGLCRRISFSRSVISR